MTANDCTLKLLLTWSFSYKSLWLSHAPIHPQEMRNRAGNVHGHLHEERVLLDSETGETDPEYFNVNLDVNNYQFVSLDTIKAHFKILHKEPS